jgi:hypothetical protein
MKKRLLQPNTALAVVAGLVLLNWAAQSAVAFNPFNPTAKSAPAPVGPASPTVLANTAVTIDAPLQIATVIHPTPIGLSAADAVSIQTAKSATPLRFLVSLTAPSKSIVTVNFATSNINADQDFKQIHGVLMFPKGMTTQYITVDVLGENLAEGKEYVSLHLYGAVGAKITNAHAVGTIINRVNPDLPRISIVGDVVGPNTRNVWVRIQMSQKSNKTVKVNFQAHRLGGVTTDFVGPTNTTLTFKPGVTQQFVQFHLLGAVTPQPGRKIELFSDSISNAVNGVIDTNLSTAGVFLIQ